MSIPKPNLDFSNSKTETTDISEGRIMLYSFSKQGIGNWRVQDDVVMGGRSNSQLKMTDERHAYFFGNVSLENNGGFCSMQQTKEEEHYKIDDKCVAFNLLVKGDGKEYNFRVRTPNGRHAYAFSFPTQNNDKWERISIPFKAMKATFRGNAIDVPNYAGENIREMQLLIGNKVEESFSILIESIEVI